VKNRTPTLIEASKTLKLAVIIESDDDVYHAYCPVLKGCHSSGDTREEAFENIQEAVKIHLEVMIEDGEDIPEVGIVDDIDQI
jgi:predicted RNase H-like HicB family nuclease